MTGVPALFTRHRGLARSIADGYFWPGAERAVETTLGRLAA